MALARLFDTLFDKWLWMGEDSIPHWPLLWTEGPTVAALARMYLIAFHRIQHPHLVQRTATVRTIQLHVIYLETAELFCSYRGMKDESNTFYCFTYFHLCVLLFCLSIRGTFLSLEIELGQKVDNVYSSDSWRNIGILSSSLQFKLNREACQNKVFFFFF